MRWLVGVAMVMLFQGCAGRTARVPESPTARVSDPSAFEPVDRDAGKRIAAMVGLPALRETAVQAGTWEIRASYIPGGMVWDVASMLRVFERNGRVEGELYLYWGELANSTGRLQTPYWRRTCTTLASMQSLVEGTGMCPVPSWHVSWPAVADSLKALGIWELLDRGDLTPPRKAGYVTDLDHVFIEGVSQGQYGSIDYYGPMSVGDAASKVLVAVGDMVVLLTRQRQFR